MIDLIKNISKKKTYLQKQITDLRKRLNCSQQLVANSSEDLRSNKTYLTDFELDKIEEESEPDSSESQ